MPSWAFGGGEKVLNLIGIKVTSWAFNVKRNKNLVEVKITFRGSCILKVGKSLIKSESNQPTLTEVV